MGNETFGFDPAKLSNIRDRVCSFGYNIGDSIGDSSPIRLVCSDGPTIENFSLGEIHVDTEKPSSVKVILYQKDGPGKLHINRIGDALADAGPSWYVPGQPPFIPHTGPSDTDLQL